MTYIIDGKQIANDIKNELKTRVSHMEQKPCLAVIQVGNDVASSVYVKNKKQACSYIGIDTLSYSLPKTISQEKLLSLISNLSNNPNVNGILVQLPLPSHIDQNVIISAISPLKDVDAFHPQNIGALYIGKPNLVNCTPAGIIELLKRSGITIEGKECVVMGRSNIVGKPMATLLLQENGTVTICHSRTKNIREVTKRADILIVAIGKPELVDDTYVKEGAVVIDVGIHRREDGKLCGDVQYEKVKPLASAITPVPGGVGPMTIAMLMQNCVTAFEKQI